MDPESDNVLLLLLLILSAEVEDSCVSFDDTLLNVIPGGSFFDKLFLFLGAPLLSKLSFARIAIVAEFFAPQCLSSKCPRMSLIPKAASHGRHFTTLIRKCCSRTCDSVKSLLANVSLQAYER